MKEEHIRKDGELTFEQPNYQIVDNYYGVASFMLTDFLKPNVRKIKLAAPIAPIKQFVDADADNLDLNTTARKETQKVKCHENYLEYASYLVCAFDLSKEIKAHVLATDAAVMPLMMLSGLKKKALNIKMRRKEAI